MKLLRLPLVSAKQLAKKPAFVPTGRPRGAKREGVKYEGLVAKHMPWALHGPWFEYRDLGGLSVCQPDLMWRWGDWVVVAEVKLTWVEEAEVKLRGLYLPVVLKALGRPTLGVVICRNLVPQVRAVYGELAPALTFAQHSLSRLPTFHWIGKGQIEEPIWFGGRERKMSGHFVPENCRLEGPA